MKKNTIIITLCVLTFLFLSCDRGHWEKGNYDFEINGDVVENSFLDWKTLDIRDINGFDNTRESIKDVKVLESFLLIKSNQFPDLEIIELKIEVKGIATFTYQGDKINSRLKIENLDYLEFITKIMKEWIASKDGKIDIIMKGKTLNKKNSDNSKISFEFYNELNLHLDD